ncbi:MAG: hypothetical protein HC888_01945 [Candidatus Competibacteraceae bacterium]|nr:hypothetical protein [Candidatus Competibacteraceae bacterium]
MSKSLGNAADPQKLLDQYSAAGLRFWASQNISGTDTRLDAVTLAKAKKLINKIRNAKRLLDMQTSGVTNQIYHDRWKDAERQIRASLEAIDWSSAIKTLRSFFWDEFCAEFIEHLKSLPCNDSLRIIYSETILYFEMFLGDMDIAR